MNIIREKKFDEERALYGISNTKLDRVFFKGPRDGESVLKETSNIFLNDSYFDLRYPLWHANNIFINNCCMTSNCRAAIWYSNNIEINDARLLGIKALRECENVSIFTSTIASPELCWKTKNLVVSDTNVESEYGFLESENIKIDKMLFKGKYSFQYAKNGKITSSKLKTKDAFWHADNLVIKDSVIEGEYLAWYSSNLTFINCKIIGTQPFCYCKNLKLIDCEMIDTDLAFEYSEVDAIVKGSILSIKNPKSGKIVADKISKVILSEDTKVKSECEIITKKK